MKLSRISQFLLFCCVAFASRVEAGIVDVLDDANSRMEDGWSGRGELEFERQQDESSYSLLNATASQFYRSGSHIYLLLLAREYGEQNEEIFSNSSFSHLRYRYLVSDHFEWELFGQFQRKPTRRLQARHLVGSGPKFILLAEERLNASIGVALMREYEDYQESGDKFSQRELLRVSIALQIAYRLNEHVSLQSSGYIQPRASYWDRRRMTNISSVAIKVGDNLDFVLSVTTSEDRDAPPDVQRYQSKISQGIAYEFS